MISRRSCGTGFLASVAATFAMPYLLKTEEWVYRVELTTLPDGSLKRTGAKWIWEDDWADQKRAA